MTWPLPLELVYTLLFEGQFIPALQALGAAENVRPALLYPLLYDAVVKEVGADWTRSDSVACGQCFRPAYQHPESDTIFGCPHCRIVSDSPKFFQGAV